MRLWHEDILLLPKYRGCPPNGGNSTQLRIVWTEGSNSRARPPGSGRLEPVPPSAAGTPADRERVSAWLDNLSSPRDGVSTKAGQFHCFAPVTRTARIGGRMKHRIAAAALGFLLSTSTYGDSPPNIVEALQTGVILEAGEIDSNTVEVGVPAVVIYGLGYRDPTGKWPRLTRARGVIRAVNSKRLLLSVGGKGRSQRIDLPRIQTLILGETSVSLSASRDTVQAQIEPVDSLAVKEIPPFWWDLENNKGLRRLKKVAAGTASGVVLTAVAFSVQSSTIEPSGDPDRDAWRSLGFLLVGSTIGCSVGFPIGVTLVDPYDSLPVTLLAGIVPAAAGIGVITIDQERSGTAFLLIYVAPVISSLIASELWRKPPQDRRVSFGLSPTFNGGFSAVTTLRF